MANEDSERSVSLWIEQLKQGHSDGARALHRDVYEQLVRLARRRLGAKELRWADEEDVALSAFDSFCAGAAQGKFPKLENRDDLWKILVNITSRKAGDYLKHNRRRKRGDGLVRGDSVFISPDGSVGGFENAPDSAQPPDLQVVVVEECRRLLESLEDESLQQIAVWKMEGYKDVEIAEKLGCVPRTIARKLERIREKWSKQISAAGD